MYTTEIKMIALKKKVLIGDALKGAIVLINLSKRGKFSLNLNKLAKYLINIDKIQSFDSIDLLYNDMFTTFCPTSELSNMKIISFVNKNASDLIDISLSNYTISSNFLEYVYYELIKKLICEFVYTKINKDDRIEVILDIPTIYISSIYFNYEDLSFDEKLDKFKEELTVWSMYNHIANITKENFEIVELKDKDVLMMQFNIINKI